MDATRIIQKRIERGITVPELARRLGVAKTTVYRYESGYIEKMPVNRLEEIARILGTTPSYLLFWSDDDNNDKDNRMECFPVDRKLTASEKDKVQQFIKELI